MPDENTIRLYRNRLTESGTLEALMQAFEEQLRERGYLALWAGKPNKAHQKDVDARWTVKIGG